MRMFRCYNPECSEDPHGRPGFDFFAESDKQANGEPLECPKCEGDAITPLLPVHLLVKDKTGPIKTAMGRRRIVCRPDVKQVCGRLTGEPVAVTCPACKASPAFKAMNAEVTAVDEHEIPVGTPLAGE